MASTITDQSSNPLAVYGYDQQTGQALAQSLGMTTEQLAAAFAQTPMTGGSAPQTTSYGMTTGGQPASRDLNATVNQLRISQAAGGGAKQAAQTGLPAGAVDYSGSRAAENLGAAALGAAGFSGAEGAFPVYNPIPGQINSPKGGIQTNVPSPVVANAIPNVQAPNVASVFGGQGQAAANQLYQQYSGGSPGTPSDVAAFYQAKTGNPISTNPVAPTAGGTPTPTTPANAPGAGQPATPYATAPPAPGASAGAPAQANWAPLMGGPPAAPTQGGGPWGEIAAHTAGLENAGKAMYTHLTGNDPSKATFEDIANFHTQLTGMIGAQTGSGPVPGSNYTAGVNQPPNTMAPAPAKMAAGGMVPGRGNRDTVPALLTPGELVIPKQQVAQMFGGRTPIRMAEGGYVPPEVRRQRLTPPGSPPPAPGQGSSGQSAGQGSSTPAAADGGGQGQQGYWSNIVNQAQAQQAANMGSGGPGSLDSLGSLGDEGLANQAIQGTGANTAAGAADVASGLFSGLAKAAAEYQKSIKPWQDVAQAFGNKGIPNYQDVNFQQDTTV